MALSTDIYAEVTTTFPANVLGAGGITIAKSGGVYTVTFVGADIALNSIALDKIEQIASDRLLGRDSDATGDIEQLTVGGGIEFTGSGGLQTSALTGDVTKAAGGTATTITNSAVANSKIADNAVTANKIADGAVTTAKLAGSAVTPAELAGGAVTLGKIATGAVTADAIASNAVGASELADNAVDQAAIADNAVDLAEMAHGTQGDVLIYGASGAPTRLGAGTSGHFLMTQGTAANPVFAAAPTGSTWTASVFTASNAAWAVPGGTNEMIIEVWGGGGSGGGGNASHRTPGGGGGGYAMKVYSGTMDATLNVTVGAGGAPPGAGINGNNGGNSSVVGTNLGTVAGNGGQGAISSASAAAGGNGGMATGGDLNIKGQDGFTSISPLSTSGVFPGGHSPRGGMGGTSNVDAAGSAPGGGGAGANHAGPGAGGAGADGLVIIWTR